MNRRLLLQGFFLSLWSAAATAACRLTGGLNVTEEPVVRAASEPTSAIPGLSAAELQSVVAFGEAVVEGRVLSAAERLYLGEYLEGRARSVPGQLAHYRAAARLLDRLAGKPFASLEISDRIELLGRHHLDSRLVRLVPPGEDPEPFADEAQIVRTRVIPDLIEGYWSSPAGWAAVGYEAFPGRCGDLTRYTRAGV